MWIRLASVVTIFFAAVFLLAIAAPLALAASWSISDPVGQDIGYVTKLSDTKYAVTKNSGTRVGTVLKTSRGWKVRRDGKYLATLKKNGPRAHPVNMYSGNGARIGRCGPTSDGDQLSLDRCAGSTVVCCVGFAPANCPKRPALGAARLLLW